MEQALLSEIQQSAAELTDAYKKINAIHMKLCVKETTSIDFPRLPNWIEDLLHMQTKYKAAASPSTKILEDEEEEEEEKEQEQEQRNSKE